MSDKELIAGRQPRFAPWLLEPMRRNKAIYAKVALAAVVINVFGIVTALFTMTIYDRVIPNRAMSSLVALSIGIGIVILFDFVLRLLRGYFVDIAGAQIDQEVSESLFERLLSMRLELKKGSTGALTGLMRELESLRDFFASATMVAIVDVPFILLTLLMVGVIGGWLVLVPAVMVPLVILVGWLTHPALDRLSARVLGGGMVKNSVLTEAIGSLETVKASGAGPLLARRWTEAQKEHSGSSLRQRLISTIGITTASSAGSLSYAGIVIVGTTMIVNNELTMGALIACSILSGRAISPLGQISSLLSRMTATRTAYRQLNEMMTMPAEGPAGDALKLGAPRGRIEFRNVTFRYPGASGKALDGVNLVFEPGERVALLGRIGSGKSTLARLILGLYPPDEGMVLIDGTDIRQLDPVSLRDQMGAALQESVLLTGSVRENIALARDHVDDEELVRAAQVSGTHQFMGQIANGYDLKLADRGEGLSGGQRQSIAIARALAGKPSILVFDEPTSAMDDQTEGGLIRRLQEEIGGRTFILITHRPTLLALVNRIVVMDQGRVVANGPRDEVLKQIAKPRAA